MIYRSHMIQKWPTFTRILPGEIKKRAHCFVAGELLLVLKCVIDI